MLLQEWWWSTDFRVDFRFGVCTDKEIIQLTDTPTGTTSPQFRLPTTKASCRSMGTSPVSVRPRMIIFYWSTCQSSSCFRLPAFLFGHLLIQSWWWSQFEFGTRITVSILDCLFIVVILFFVFLPILSSSSSSDHLAGHLPAFLFGYPLLGWANSCGIEQSPSSSDFCLLCPSSSVSSSHGIQSLNLNVSHNLINPSHLSMGC